METCCTDEIGAPCIGSCQLMYSQLTVQPLVKWLGAGMSSACHVHHF